MLTKFTIREAADEAIQPDRLKISAREFTDTEFFQGKDIVIIEPNQFFSSLSLKNLWQFRELLYYLALRDIKIRYKQTILGIGWVLLQPIVTTIIFTTIFLRLGASQNLEIPYPLFAFSGFTLWTFINSAITNCSGSLLNHSGLITKVYFPRLIIPIAAAGATLFDLVFGFISLLFAIVIYGVTPSWQLLLAPLLIIPALFLSLGLGILTAALNVRYRDVKYILPFLIQVFFFISPVFYSLSMLPEESIWLWKFNPLTGILENFRALLFGLSFDWYSFLLSVVVSAAVFFSAVYVFHQMEDDFADVI
jgi:lipopolysaccharide transport system permease protein